MQLDEFYNYKNQLIGDLLTDDTIVNLINENVTSDKAKKLMFTQVFPYEYVPETVEEGNTFICCDVDINRVSDSLFYYPTLMIWIFSHKSKLRLPTGGVRTDKLCSEICKKINGSKLYGLGELSLYSVKRFAPMTDFQGKCMTFIARDFNRVHDPKAKIPGRRKDL